MLIRPLDQRRRKTQFIKDVAEVLTTISRHGLAERGLSIVTQAAAILYVEGKAGIRTYDTIANGVMVVTAHSDTRHYRNQVERILGPVEAIHADIFGTVYAQKG